MKKDSAISIKMIKDSSHRICMITGDNNLTACQVATELEIATKPVLILNSHEGNSSITL